MARVRRVAPLAATLAVAAFLRLYDLTAAGFGNQYYAATVKSMTTSLAAFLYGSFDPGLFVSVDKPAPGLWPQAIAARLFGFSSLTLFLPQAICGVLSVAVLYAIVRRAHGALAGTLAALALAVAPIAVAVDRNNTMDAELVLVLLIAVWFALRALETGPRALLAAAALVGAGFAIKMGQAYLAAPAIVVTYAIAARPRLVIRLAHAAAASFAIVAVSAIWIALVDLTPAASRPWVGSSPTNSALELALGHNGLDRLPQEILFWRLPSRAGGVPAALPAAPGPGPLPLAPVAPGADEAGERGPLRLFNDQLGGQISWYLPLALIGAAAAFAREPRRPLVTRARSSVLLWLVWLIPAAVLFSWSGIFHRYYLVMLAPPLAALVGAGAPALVALARGSVVWRALAVGAAVLTAATHVTIVTRSDYATWTGAAAAAGALALVIATLDIRARDIAAALAAAALFAGPVAWSATTLVGFDAGLPYAGPQLLPRAGVRPPFAPVGQAVPPRSPLLEFLLSEHRDERWIAAAPSVMTAAPLMLRADVAVMALGGFSGGDPIVNDASLERLVRRGDVRFVVTDQRPMRADLERWVRLRCVPVPPQRYGGAPGPSPQGATALMVFDCARVRAA
jgi:4-amino-4-deoxy-L-arabinose transferase-like glycosyltransferase